MCRETVNLEEAQLSLRQLQDLIRHAHRCIREWNRMAEDKGLDALEGEFSRAEGLAGA